MPPRIEVFRNPIKMIQSDNKDDIYIDFNNATMEESSESDSSDDSMEENTDTDINSGDDDINDDHDYLTSYYHGSKCLYMCFI